MNAQFSGDGLDLATVLYRIALGGSLGELVPTLGKGSLSDSLDVAILWRTIPVPKRLRTGVGTGLRLWDAAEFSPGFSWVRGDVDWNLYTGDLWRLNVTGGVSYTDAWMWQRLPGATLSLQAGYRFKQGELLFELGYARNHIDVLSRLPLEEVETVKLRVAVIAWL